MKQIDIDYEVGEKVEVKLTGRIGKVIGVWKDKEGDMNYNVEWACDDGDIHDRWFKVNELERF